MNNPRVIYIGKTIWSEEPITKESKPYFSEENIREVLPQVLVIGYSQNPELAKSIAHKFVEDTITKLKGGE